MNPHRGRTRERGQRPSRPDRRRPDGQRARELPHLHPTPSSSATTHADGRTAARRTATAQAGRHQGAIVGRPLPAISAEKAPRDSAQAASATDAEREGQGAPANPPELLGLHPLERGRTRQKRGAAARQPPRQTQQPPPPKQPPPDHTPAACGGKRILGRRQALGMG